MRLIALLLLPALASCGPVTVAGAERSCLAVAKQARGTYGSAAVGAGTGGVKSKLDITLSADLLPGRDPSAEFDACVYRKTGQPPSRPLYTRPDWKG